MKSNDPTIYELAQFDFSKDDEFGHVYDQVEKHLGFKSVYLFKIIATWKGVSMRSLYRGLEIAYPKHSDVANAVSELNFFLEKYDLTITSLNGDFYLWRAVTNNSQLATDGNKKAKGGKL